MWGALFAKNDQFENDHTAIMHSPESYLCSGDAPNKSQGGLSRFTCSSHRVCRGSPGDVL